MKTRIVHSKIYEDKWFRSLGDPKLRYLFLYLITNSHINKCGIYELSVDYIAFESQLSAEEIPDLIIKLHPKVQVHDGWIYVPNALKLGGYKSPKLIISLYKEVMDIPRDILEHFQFNEDSLSIAYALPIDSPINNKYKTINNKSKTIKGIESVQSNVVEGEVLNEGKDKRGDEWKQRIYESKVQLYKKMGWRIDN